MSDRQDSSAAQWELVAALQGLQLGRCQHVLEARPVREGGEG